MKTITEFLIDGKFIREKDAHTDEEEIGENNGDILFTCLPSLSTGAKRKCKKLVEYETLPNLFVLGDFNWDLLAGTEEISQFDLLVKNTFNWNLVNPINEATTIRGSLIDWCLG